MIQDLKNCMSVKNVVDLRKIVSCLAQMISPLISLLSSQNKIFFQDKIFKYQIWPR